MKHLILTFLCLIGIGCIKASAQISLEHTFSGYYFPYNFPIVVDTDNDKYFSDMLPTFNESTNTFYTRTYNEDYSIRKTINVRLEGLSSGYKVSQVAYSPTFTLTNDTPVIVVIGTSKSITLGSSGYCKCWLFDAESGQMIQQLETSTFNVIVQNSVFEINGKRCIIVTGSDYSLSTGAVNYQTKVYSIGESKSFTTAPSIEALNIRLRYMI